MTRFIPILIVTTFAPGCGNPLPKITVLQGRVTLEGVPLKVGYVGVISADNVTTAGANINPEGIYRIVGAPTGPVLFTVNTRDYAETAPAYNDDGVVVKSKRNSAYKEIPEKYSSFATSGLKTVIADDQDVYDIELTSK